MDCAPLQTWCLPQLFLLTLVLHCRGRSAPCRVPLDALGLAARASVAATTGASVIPTGDSASVPLASLESSEGETGHGVGEKEYGEGV